MSPSEANPKLPDHGGCRLPLSAAATLSRLRVGTGAQSNSPKGGGEQIPPATTPFPPMSRPDLACSSLSPNLRTLLTEKTDRLLLRIVRANFNTQYASQAPSLAAFRETVAAHGTEVDDALLQDFRSHVALMDYESYKPFVARFNEQPCKESEVKNLFAPGLPFALALSSSTSGNAPKMFAKYYHIAKEAPSRPSVYDRSDVKGPEDRVIYYGYMELKEVQRESGEVVQRIPLGISSGTMLRMASEWSVDGDESRMSVLMPGQAAPWAASLITHHRSFLIIHALFCLVSRDLDRLIMTFAPVFMDLLRHVDDEWDMMLTCIKDGTIPDLDGIDYVRAHLQVHLHANPGRATELREIGSPFSCAGWVARVWPKMRMLVAVSSGPYAFVLPKVDANHLYFCSEIPSSSSGEIRPWANYRYPRSWTEDVVEFLDAAVEETHQNILQPWDLEAGKHYQVVLTTRDGLWRYPLGDIIEIVGFDLNGGSPVFKYTGRKSSSIRLWHALISDSDLVAAVQAISSEDIIQVHEFTVVVDDRELPATVGYFVEGSLGSKSHIARQKLFDALVATNISHQFALDNACAHLPTIRIVKPGTFMAYRLRKGEKLNIGAGQTKVPVVLPESTSKEWIEEKVVQEL
ncbi:hypothetical protein PAXINDRAFT_100832 [Paxillus involutus ATCC 200175]|uniref:GH3 middle domain-containing protein n=1 Tax=Paxillus involutus ATCC 200175 TaxID=664439 RepID=A0A0C9TSD3_PAXIN|nr:hypothetical protein PAXINDRAFT_100832 [Paxillus involutus ATCC 200175]